MAALLLKVLPYLIRQWGRRANKHSERFAQVWRQFRTPTQSAEKNADFVADPDAPKPVIRWNAHHDCRLGNVFDDIANVELWPPEQGRVREDGAVERDEEPVDVEEGKTVELAEIRQIFTTFDAFGITRRSSRTASSQLALRHSTTVLRESAWRLSEVLRYVSFVTPRPLFLPVVPEV